MQVSGMHVGPVPDEHIDQLLEDLAGRGLTYDHACSTLTNAPDGIDDRIVTLATAGSLEAARRTLRRWVTHDGIKASIHPDGAPLVVGTTVVVVAPFGPVRMIAPARIVAVADDDDRFGFAYGTLPGHPVSGEELFMAEVAAPGRLRLTVRVHARPATPLLRMAGPVVSRISDRAAHSYLRSWASAIEAEPLNRA